MKRALVRLAYGLQIRLLMLFNAAALFRRLNRLDWYQGALRRWVNALNLQPGTTVLEIGCGTGELSEYLATSGYRVTAVDSSERMLASALANASGGVRYVLGTAMSLRFPDNAFEAVVSASVLNSIDDKQRVLAEMVRVCKPGGLISFLAPSTDFDQTRLDALVGKLGARNFSEAGLRTWYRMARKMSVAESESLLAEAGATPCEAKYYLDGKVFSVAAVKGGQ